MASMKRELASIDEPQFKKAKVVESEPSHWLANSNLRVVLNPADCDIDFNVEGNGLLGSALYEEGFAYCWSGSRANIGITRGKYCFGCKIVSAQPVQMEDTPVDKQHVCRVGISRGDDVARNLGETTNSFGFGGTGKFSNSGQFFDYGKKFGVGDTIVCAVDLESKPMASIGFSKNGKWLGVAKHFDAGPGGLGVVGSPIKKMQWESALFPHVLLKNVIVQVQFSIDDGLIPEEGYRPWASAILDGNCMLGPSLSDQSDCEVIMMVGLPASGKTTWAEKWVKEHPEKRHVLLGTNLALEQMKVPGLLRKNNYGERFERLMYRATKIFNVLLSRASRIPRNFIIDQTNVYKSARKRKLKPFANYIKIAVVVFPRADELKVRTDKRFKEMGKEVRAEALNEMLANYTLPMSKDMPVADEYFDQVLFVELNRVESQRSLDEMKRCVSVRSYPPPYSRESSLMSCSSFQHDQTAPMQSFRNQGVGDRYLSSYPSQPPSGAPHGSHYSSPFTNEPMHGFYYTGSLSGNDYTRINNPPSSMLPTYGGMGEVHQSYGADTFLGPKVDPRQSSSIQHDPRTAPLSYNTLDDRYANRSGGTPYPATLRPSEYQSATPFPHGSYGSQIPTFPNNVQHAGVYPQPALPMPPYANVQHPGLYPRPPRGY